MQDNNYSATYSLPSASVPPIPARPARRAQLAPGSSPALKQAAPHAALHATEHQPTLHLLCLREIQGTLACLALREVRSSLEGLALLTDPDVQEVPADHRSLQDPLGTSPRTGAAGAWLAAGQQLIRDIREND